MAPWDDRIDFDNVSDWPMELCGWLHLLASPPADPDQRAPIVQQVRICLQRSWIRTYHCARLLPSEIEAIQRDGLKPATSELASEKGEAARASGRPLPFGAHPDPSGKIWFYHRRADLEAAISGRFLRSWGGVELLASTRGVVDTAAQPYIFAFDYPAEKLKYVFGRGRCSLESKVISRYLTESTTVSPADTAFESFAEKPVRVEAREIIPASDARFSAFTDYCDEFHFHVA